jgi:hypothetical protein
MAQMVEHLSREPEAMNSIPSTTKRINNNNNNNKSKPKKKIR